MIPSTLFAIVASVVLAVNGAVVQRDGTFTFLTPQPTVQASPPPASGGSTSPTSSVPPSSAPPSSVPPSSLPPSSAPPVSSPPTSVPPTSTSATVPPVSKTSATTGTATPTSTSGTVNCNNVQGWQADFAYVAGNQAIFKGQLFTALQWTYNNAPPQHPDQWSFGGVCTQPINNKVSCAGVAAWQQSVAYTSGNQVTFNGHLWSATQWTQSNSPGDTSGIWKDLGACM